MSWMRTVAGRLESRYRYAQSVWFAFPLPVDKDTSHLAEFGQAVLDARAADKGSNLAALYDAEMMPPKLRSAHAALDKAVDKVYRKQGFASDRERVEHLFEMNQTATKSAKKPTKAQKTRKE